MKNSNGQQDYLKVKDHLTFKTSQNAGRSCEMTDRDVISRFAAIWDLKVNGPYQTRPQNRWITNQSQLGISSGAREKVFEIVMDIYPDLAERRRAKCDEFIDWYQNKCLS